MVVGVPRYRQPLFSINNIWRTFENGQIIVILQTSTHTVRMWAAALLNVHIFPIMLLSRLCIWMILLSIYLSYKEMLFTRAQFDIPSVIPFIKIVLKLKISSIDDMVDDCEWFNSMLDKFHVWNTSTTDII